MDRTPEEKIAVMRAAAELIAQGILVAEPYFDREGGDLLGLTAVGQKAAICRIQVKYRDTTGVSVNELVIPRGYVDGAFVLFLNLKTNQGDRMLCLLPDDIKHHAKEGRVKKTKVYRLRLTGKLVSELVADVKLTFNENRAGAIKLLADSSSAAFAVHQEFLGFAQRAGELIRNQAEIIKLREILNKIELANQGIQITNQMISALELIESAMKDGKKSK